MLIKTKAIVFSTVKFQEKSLIVKCFTESNGIKTYFVPNAFSSSKNNRKIAYFQPLTILEIEANHKNKGTLEHFKEIKLATSYQTIPNDIYKSTIVIFISEVVHHCIHEEEKNTELFHFLETALLWLDTHEEVANFHLILLIQLTKFLGFYPDSSNSSNSFFDINEGNFVPHQTLNSISETETLLFKKLLELKFNTPQKIFTASHRQLLLKILLQYYAIHLDGFKKPKSLEVLKEVFA